LLSPPTGFMCWQKMSTPVELHQASAKVTDINSTADNCVLI
jgi:hypothetical protein